MKFKELFDFILKDKGVTKFQTQIADCLIGRKAQVR